MKKSVTHNITLRSFASLRLCVGILLLIINYQLSTAQQWHTTLDIWQPAEKELPKMDRVLIVNNIAQQPFNYGHKNRTNGIDYADTEIDLQNATRTALFVAANALQQTDQYSAVDLLDLPYQQTTFPTVKPLTQTQANELMQQYQVDAVLACNLMLTYDLQDVFLTESSSYYAVLSTYNTMRWTVYTKNNTPINYVYQDSLFWEAESYNSTTLLQQLPNREDAVQDMMLYATERFFNQFQGHWNTEDRYLYSTDTQTFTAAMELFRRQHWTEAAVAFDNIYKDNKSSKTDRAYAAANLAVTYEIQNNLTAAIHWAEQAAKDFGKLKTPDGYQQQVNLKYYQKQLEQRLL